MRDGRAQRADDDRNVLLLDQPFGRRHADVRLAGIVGVESFDWAPQSAASLVDAVERKLRAILFGLAAIRRRAAENGGDADLYRLRGMGRGRCDQACEQKGGARHGSSWTIDWPARLCPFNNMRR